MRAKFISMGFDIDYDLQLVIEFDSDDERLLARQFLRYKGKHDSILRLNGYEGHLGGRGGGDIRIYFDKESKK